jgi:hypothetical protein
MERTRLYRLAAAVCSVGLLLVSIRGIARSRPSLSYALILIGGGGIAVATVWNVAGSGELTEVSQRQMAGTLVGAVFAIIGITAMLLRFA